MGAYGKGSGNDPTAKSLFMEQHEWQPKAAKKRALSRKLSVRIDMTPMVDLGFLLITFFIFTTTMAEKRAMKLVVPTLDGSPTNLAASKALTILLGGSNKLYAYEGSWEDAVRSHKIITTDYSAYNGIGKLIREKQQQLQQTDREGKDGLVLLIKPTGKATYKNVIDVLDEAVINNVKKQVLVDASPDEALFTRQ
jgi:biopolymer transport protein ExbD